MDKRPPRLPPRVSATPRASATPRVRTQPEPGTNSSVATIGEDHSLSAEGPGATADESGANADTSVSRRSHLRLVDSPDAVDLADSPQEGAEESVQEPLSGVEWKRQRAERWAQRIRSFWGNLENANPYTTFWLILGSTLALSVIGLTMVLSSTSAAAAGESFAVVSRQAAWALLGLVLMSAIIFMPRRVMTFFGWALMIFSVVLLALTVFTPLGMNINGSTNWIAIGPFQGQPSEFAKLGLVIWGAAVLAKKGPLVTQFTHWVVPFVLPGALTILTLVLVGGDLGTGIVIVLIVGAMLYVAGVSMRYFLAAATVAVMAITLLMILTPYRMQRVNSWLGLNCDAPSEPCHQTEQGYYALSSGGFWGVGLGQSRQRWGYIPEIQNDFIFTVLGEELGLLGTLLVLSIFALLAIGIFRVAFSATDMFTRLVCLGVAVWLIGQAFINIGMVTGVIPVVGVPLPFISAGGSAMTVCLMAIGVILNLARSQRRHMQRAATGVHRVR